MNRLVLVASGVMFSLIWITGCTIPSVKSQETPESVYVPVPDTEGILDLYKEGFGLSRECYYKIEAAAEQDGNISTCATMDCHVQGYDTLLFFTAPDRIKGMALLKKGNQLWLWQKDVDRQTRPRPISPRTCSRLLNIGPLVQIIGTSWRDLFRAERALDETLNGRECYVLRLTAISKAIFFEHAKMWIEKQSKLPAAQDFICVDGSVSYHATYEFKSLSDTTGKKVTVAKISIETVGSNKRYTYTFSEYDTKVDPIVWDDFLFQDR